MSKEKLSLTATLLLLFLQTVFAQTRSISGKITDEQGNPIANVSVLVKGSKTGTVSAADGTYTLTVPSDAKTIVFSSVDLALKEVALGSQSQLDVSMAPAERSLQEVVVVGYGTKIKRDITGAVAKVGSKELANTPATSFESALQGRAAGVFIEQQNGKVGQAIKVRIRGASSVTAGNEPLYVIDGIPVITADLSSNGATTNPLSDINTNDIESIEILKDASSAAIYGAQASNGVVLITTKHGKAGKSKIDFGYFTGLQKPTGKREFLNAEEYVKYALQASDGGARYDFKNNISGYATEQEALDD